MSDADTRLGAFVAAMAAAGNPGAGRHEVGMHHVHGWVLLYDPAIGGNQVQAVIGVDGMIHAVRNPTSLRVHKMTGAEWAAERDGGEPLGDRLDEILVFNGVQPGAAAGG